MSDLAPYGVLARFRAIRAPHAADLLREVCVERFGSVEQAVAVGLSLRYDGGSCFRSEARSSCHT